MNIYIYGSDSFKKEINQVLEKGNVKFRLDEKGTIEVVETLSELKLRIEENPDDIYLIDDSKIIKKNSINDKIKFLKPKDGIEEEFLKNQGVKDINVDSYEDLSKHINKKLESMHLNDNFDENSELDNVRESIIDIVDEAYSNSDERINKEENEFEIGELDDELSSLLTSDGIDESENDFESVNSTSFDLDEKDDEKSIIEDEEAKEFPIEENYFTQDLAGENNMSDDFSELDNLLESDILEALDDVDVSSFDVPKSTVSSSIGTASVSNNSRSNLEISSSNIGDLASLLKELLNNKTLEITIKIKD